MNKRLLPGWLLVTCVLLGSALPARSQWITQSFDLKPGWNAVFLHVDASHATLDELVGGAGSNPIQEVWLWNPAPATAQFVESPQLPTEAGSQWLSWSRSLGTASPLQRLMGNAAYLVRLDSSSGPYIWNLKGRPLAPHYAWTSSGQNFLGFPTPTTPAPSWESFLGPAPGLLQGLEVYAYTGGELGPNNPARVFAYRTTLVRRGEAFWLRSGSTFNQYFGPFEVVLEGGSGAVFGDSASQRRLRLRNLVAREISVSLEFLNSETPPAGQPAIVEAPPLLLRGERNLTNLTYGSSEVTLGSRFWKTLAPAGEAGSETELVLGVNRSSMLGHSGGLYAGVLRLKDSLGLSQIDLGVSATVTSSAGLWVGEALVSQVRHNLKQYQKDADGLPVVSPTGGYVPTGTNTTLGAVGRPFPLRLILHNDRVNTVLLQRVYYGLRQSNAVAATSEALLDKEALGVARRISANHLPWTAANLPWMCSGDLRLGGQVSATINLGYDDHASNPFLHTYHPDHDNLDAQFGRPLVRGEESYGLTRNLKLRFNPPAGDFSSLTGTGQTLSGDYEEIINLGGKGADSRQYEVHGAFTLTRISNLPTLTTP
jgi:hypothetical protein